MLESQWRSKLIALRRKTNPTDFIWAMDAKFKAGFPDIYLLIKGQPYHIELKINKFYQPYNGLDKIQKLTLQQLSAAMAKCFCLNLQDDNNIGITEQTPTASISKLRYEHDFYKLWAQEVPFLE